MCPNEKFFVPKCIANVPKCKSPVKIYLEILRVLYGESIVDFFPLRHVRLLSNYKNSSY